MRNRTNAILSSLLLLSILYSCNNSTSSVSGYTTSPNGLQYKLIKTGGSPKAEVGQYVAFATTSRTIKGDVFSKSSDGGKDLVGFVAKPRHKGDPLEVLAMMAPGDSSSVIIPESEFFNDASVPLPAGVNKGDNIMMDIKLHKVYTQDEYVKEFFPERKTIQDFIASKGWKAEMTPDGLFIVVDEPGTGAAPENGKLITMNYTGTLLDGTKFDSNVDPAFGHVSPFQFPLGKGQVIRGWDEGVPHFKVGGKGKLIIPSNLGYGVQGSPPKIPGNSILVFDVEVVDVKDAPQQPAMGMPGQPFQIHQGQ